MGSVRLALVEDPVDPESLEVWVDGFVLDDPVRFRLDSGAGRCTVPVLPATVGLAAVRLDPATGLSGIGLADDEVVVPRLGLGEVVIENVEATRLRAGSPLPPLLGMTALERFVCEFRFSAGALALEAPGRDVGHHQWLPLASHVGGQPVVPLTFDSLELSACWDTGAGLSAVDVGVARANPDLFTPLRAAVGLDSSGVEVASHIGLMAPFDVGGIRVGVSACAIVDFGPLNGGLDEPIRLVLGMPAIVQADWTFDFPRRRWRVQLP